MEQQASVFLSQCLENISQYKGKQQEFIDVLSGSLTPEKYNLLGSVLFLVYGKEFMFGISYNKQLSDGLNQRLQQVCEHFEFETSTIREVLETVEIPTQEECQKYIDLCDKEYTETRFANTTFKSILNEILEGITIPMNNAEFVHTMLGKFTSNSVHSPEELIKINTVLTSISSMPGYLLSEQNRMQTSTDYIEKLTIATKLFNNVKYAMLFSEGCQSTLDAFARFQKQYSGDVRKFAEFDESLVIQQSQDQEQAETVVEDQNQIDPNDPIYSDPKAFVESFINEYASGEVGKRSPITLELFEQFIDKIIKDTADLKSIITYLIQTASSETSNQDNYNIAKELMLSIGTEYKKNVEELCQDIPEEHRLKLNKMIYELVLQLHTDSSENKIYLVNFLVDPSECYSTWSQLLEMLSIIDYCEIKGKYTQRYMKLVNYLAKNCNWSGILETSQAITDTDPKLETIKHFLNFWADKNTED